MHGLLNRSLQTFLRDTYGVAFLAEITAESGVDPSVFDTMQPSDVTVSERIVVQASSRLAKPCESLLEDYGIYLAAQEPLRRLLRFGGIDYPDFLQSLGDLPGRARMAVADLILPDIALTDDAPGRCHIRLRGGWCGLTYALSGILRAMADDYGALALIEVAADHASIRIELLDLSFAAGRQFALAEGRP